VQPGLRRGVILVLLGLVGALSVGAASADTSVSRILDRTYTCATGYLGGIYQAQLEVYGRVHDPAAGDRLAYGEVTTTPSWRLAGLGTSWVEINPTHCNPLEAPGTLATRGLRGGQVGGLGRVVRCETPARLVVRIRGAFTRATALRPYHVLDLTFLRAEAPARVTTVGLSTIKGRPIATLRIENGKAFLFTSANCEED
jgi:hypothetical protein